MDAPRHPLSGGHRRRAGPPASISSRSRACRRGTTSRCPRVAGLMSMNATVRSSSCDDLRRELAGDDLAEDAVGIAHGHSGSLVGLGARRPAADQLPGPLDRLLARGDLAGEARLLELGEDPPELAARAAAPPRARARRPAAAGAAGRRATPAPRPTARARAPGDGRSRRRIPARASPAGRPRSAVSRRPAPARRRVGSGRSARRLERHLVDQEAEAQVVAGQRRHVLAQPLAGAQAASSTSARHLGPGARRAR